MGFLCLFFYAHFVEFALNLYIKFLKSRDKNQTDTNDYARNRIIFGAPGTGKSYILKQQCESFVDMDKFERVTFYPDYSYSQFVGTYKPVMDDDGKNIRYEYVAGPFLRVYAKACANEENNYVLLIEEINRAKVSAVFGDIFQLLDRNESGASEYPIQASEDIKKYLKKHLKKQSTSCDESDKISIPRNMYIWATMNSADQGVYPMDTAFKRRWDFEYLDIDQNEKEIQEEEVEIPKDGTIKWNALRKAINAKMLDFNVNEDKLLGTFFIPKETLKDKDKFTKTFKNKVIMYLYEDAVKQRRKSFFSGCGDEITYSSICKKFEDIGIEIFGGDFKKVYYDKQNKQENKS